MRRFLFAFLLSGALFGVAVAETDRPPRLISVGNTSEQLSFSLLVGGRLEGVSDFPLDRKATSSDTGAGTDVHLRVGARFESKRFSPWTIVAEYEQDVITGAFSGVAAAPGTDMPYDRPLRHTVRKAYAKVSLGPLVHLAGGLMISHWGLGLIANDGAQQWSKKTLTFGDPRDGDVNLRLALFSGPLTSQNLMVGVLFDWVQQDDILEQGDRARQLVGVLEWGALSPDSVGIYSGYRWQEALDGDSIGATFVDVFAHSEFDVGNLQAELSFEGVLILGKTTLGSNLNSDEKKLLQLGGAFRGRLGNETAGVLLDVLYASGDQNLDDDAQNNFRADPNYELSLLLYRQVLASQSGRAVATASDPLLSGIPADDIDRFPTKGGISNTVAFFPRGYWQPFEGLVIYGGPLFAFTEVRNTDPLNTKVAGGAPRNALGGDPGSFLGTELDLGVRYRRTIHRTELMVGVEGGVFFAGSALAEGSQAAMSTVYGGRFILQYRL